jgi:predicted ATP-grasp superfamily ATP-dependent carboligase
MIAAGRTLPSLRSRIGTVLVTDAGCGGGLAVIRSLGGRGWRTIAGDSDTWSPGFASRFAWARLVYPDPAREPDAYARAIEAAVRRERPDLLIPVSDAAILPLLGIRRRIEEVCRLAVPDEEVLETTRDKRITLRIAEDLGIPVPAYRTARTVEEALRAASSLGWPVALKPISSRAYDPSRRVIEKLRVTYAAGPGELAGRMRRFEGRHEVLVQEYRPGTGCGVELLADAGRPVAAFQHRRLAEIPVTGGVSAWRESVPLDPVLYGHAERLVGALGFTGLLMVEFKVGERPWLMEVNGRIWGSLALAVKSGMDFPARLADLLMDGTEDGGPVATEYRVGVRSFNLELALRWIAETLLCRRPHPCIPRQPRWRAFAALAGLLSPRQKLDVGSLDDPAAFFADILRILRKLGRRRSNADPDLPISRIVPPRDKFRTAGEP